MNTLKFTERDAIELDARMLESYRSGAPPLAFVKDAKARVLGFLFQEMSASDFPPKLLTKIVIMVFEADRGGTE